MEKYIKTEYYEIKYKDIIFKIDEIHPLIELKRENILRKIKHKFFLIFSKYAEFAGYSSKPNKSLIDITNDLLSRFIMSLLSKNNTDDPIIPTKIESYDILEDELKTMIFKNHKYDEKGGNKILKKIMEKYKKHLGKMFYTGYTELLKYYKSEFYNKLKHNKRIDIIKNHNEIALYYDDNPIFIKERLLNKILNRLVIDVDDKYVYIWCLCKRYIMLSSYNNQLAVNSGTMKQISSKFNIHFELFGSVFNTANKSYCSLFYDIEKIFGSYGSFFDIQIISGNFSANPPFDNKIIHDMAYLMEHFLKQSDKHIFFLIWIPIWDLDDKFTFVFKQCTHDNRTLEELNKKFADIHGKEKLKIPFEYYGYNMIKKSSYYKHIRKVCMKDIAYVNYINYKYKYVANTYVIGFSNNKINKHAIDNLKLK
jgi:hypothetical protein